MRIAKAVDYAGVTTELGAAKTEALAIGQAFGRRRSVRAESHALLTQANALIAIAEELTAIRKVLESRAPRGQENV